MPAPRQCSIAPPFCRLAYHVDLEAPPLLRLRFPSSVCLLQRPQPIQAYANQPIENIMALPCTSLAYPPPCLSFSHWRWFFLYFVYFDHVAPHFPCCLFFFFFPVDNVGESSGRFLADDYFTILSGEQWAFRTGSLRREVYRPGDQHFLPRGTAKQYKMPEGAWALEYARGNILSMMPFGFADALFSTLDFWSLGHTVYISAYGVIRSLARSLLS